AVSFLSRPRGSGAGRLRRSGRAPGGRALRPAARRIRAALRRGARGCRSGRGAARLRAEHLRCRRQSRRLGSRRAGDEAGASGAAELTVLTEWLGADKYWGAALLLLAGAGRLIVARRCHPGPQRAITSATFDAEYVGPLKGVLSARGIGSGGEIGLGYGMASRRTYARFSKLLDVSEDDIRKIRAAGAPYQIGMLDRDIVMVSGARGSVISYEDYAARAARYRDLLLAT